MKGDFPFTQPAPINAAGRIDPPGAALPNPGVDETPKKNLYGLLPAVAVILAFALFRAWYVGRFPLLEAETYYWTWSLKLAPGYYDHPPMIAILIRVCTAMAGHSALGIRLGPILLGSIGSLFFYLLCRRLSTAQTAFLALLFLSFAPFFLPFAMAATPDSPLMFFWILSLYCFWRAYQENAVHWWLFTGAATGLSILSKYNGFQLPLAFFLFLLLTERGRGHLRSWRPYLALGLAIAVASPNLLWNYLHGASTIKQPFSHGFNLTKALSDLSVFIVLPFLCLTPVMALLWLRQSWQDWKSGRLREDEALLFAACASWLPLGCFAALSPGVYIHGQWVAPCFVTALPVLFWGHGGRKLQVTPATLKTGFFSGFAIVALALTLPFIAMHAASKPTDTVLNRTLVKAGREMYGWSQLGERLRHELKERNRPHGTFLTADGYHLLSAMIWLTDNRAPATVLPSGCAHQFLLSTIDKVLIGHNAIYVAKGEADREALKRCFDRFTELEPERIIIGGREIRRFQLYYCESFRGSIRR